MKKDTSPEMQARYLAMLQALSPGERLEKASRMFASARILALAGLADEPNPEGYSMRARLFLRFYGGDFPEPELSRIVARLNLLS